MLRGDDHRLDALRLVADVLHGNLALAIGPQEIEHAFAARRSESRCTSLCAIMIGSGISSAVSSQA